MSTSQEEVDNLMSQCWSEEADDIVTEISKLIAGLQVPVSLGMGRDGILGTAYEPWLALWEQVGGGWKNAEEVENSLREKLGMPYEESDKAESGYFGPKEDADQMKSQDLQ